MAMKTMTIYKTDLNIRELQDQSTNARQAVIKWVLASDLFDTMIVGMRNYDQINEYLSVSGTTSLNQEDQRRLEILEAAATRSYCRPGCDGCYGSCPADLPIPDILRYKMYFENYGDQKYAMNLYRQLPASQTAEICVNCSAPCNSSCRYELPVRERLLEAHRQLTLA
jgi:predicted aldo/keto reductase-like oxidoreductase